jgi:hypothetical protein
MDDDARPARLDGLKLERVAEVYRLLTPGGDALCDLNDTAVALWELCDGGTAVWEMVDAVQALFELDAVVANVEVRSALDQLVAAGALRHD